MLKLAFKTILFLLLCSIATSPLFACNQPPGYGFIVHSILRDETSPIPIDSDITNQSLTGNFSSADSNTAGDRSEWVGTTDGSGLLSELGKASPATWQVTYDTGDCSSVDPIRFGPVSFLQHFAANSTPQKIICIQLEAGPDGISADPGTMDSSTGIEYTVTMTDTSEAWPRSPATWVNFDAYGDVMQTGGIGGVTDSYNCWMSYYPEFDNTHGSGLEYLWLQDANGHGIGYAQITVTNGTGGGG